MQNSTFTKNQNISVIILFILGSSIVTGVNSTAGQDAWISLLLAALLFIPMMLVYSRIISLFPEKGLFEIIDTVLDKITSKLFIVLMTWYAIHLCALVLRNFTEYVNIISLPETPTLVVMVSLLIVIMYLAKSKAATFGGWAIIAVFIVSILVLSTILPAIKEMDFQNLLPVFSTDNHKIWQGASELFAFPFAEIVLLLPLGDCINKKDNIYKIFAWGILYGTFIMLLVVIRNTAVLGVPMIKESYFPSFTMARTIHVGEFLSRIEGTISVNLVFAGITKMTVCLISASKGISSLFRIQDYHHMVFPIAMLVLALCTILYQNVIEMFSFLKYYAYYALPFQILLPLCIWIAAERYVKKQKSVYGKQAA